MIKSYATPVETFDSYMIEIKDSINCALRITYDLFIAMNLILWLTLCSKENSNKEIDQVHAQEPQDSRWENFDQRIQEYIKEFIIHKY